MCLGDPEEFSGKCIFFECRVSLFLFSLPHLGFWKTKVCQSASNQWLQRQSLASLLFFITIISLRFCLFGGVTAGGSQGSLLTGLGDHIGCQGSKPGWPYIRQASYLRHFFLQTTHLMFYLQMPQISALEIAFGHAWMEWADRECNRGDAVAKTKMFMAKSFERFLSAGGLSQVFCMCCLISSQITPSGVQYLPQFLDVEAEVQNGYRSFPHHTAG